MKCPYCAYTKSSVLESRDSEDEQSIRRRRQCLGCNKRFTTYERVEFLDIKIIKKNGDLQRFDRNKMKSGILLACEKRHISDQVINNLIDEVEMEVLKHKINPISSLELGKMISARLKKIDPVVYLRFTSVFQEFKSVEEFKNQIKKLDY